MTDFMEAKADEVRSCAPAGHEETYINSKWPELSVLTRGEILRKVLYETDETPSMVRQRLINQICDIKCSVRSLFRVMPPEFDRIIATLSEDARKLDDEG